MERKLKEKMGVGGRGGGKGGWEGGGGWEGSAGFTEGRSRTASQENVILMDM